jgi:hypothetical protein
MPPPTSAAKLDPLSTRVRVPDHVVHRRFPAETVVLNLETGRYHGLNPTGGRMLEVVESAANLRQAANQLANEYGRALGEIERDLRAFCIELAERGLVVLEPAGA